MWQENPASAAPGIAVLVFSFLDSILGREPLRNLVHPGLPMQVGRGDLAIHLEQAHQRG